jgi:hypothetical protein
VTLLRTDVSEELSASIIRVTRICELGTTLAVTSNRRTLLRNTNFYYQTARGHISEYAVAQLLVRVLHCAREVQLTQGVHC